MKQLAILPCALATLVGACADPNEIGNLEASRIGDVSNPAQRGELLQAFHDACGPGNGAIPGSVITRQPYVQLVQPTEATVGWVSRAATGERIDVTLPTGELVASADAAAEVTVTAEKGEHQKWARLVGLAPSTVYCYQIADATGTLTDRIGFRTAPTADDTGVIRALVFGDSGSGGPDQSALHDMMYEFPYDLVLHTGDLAYEDGTLQQFEQHVFGVYHPIFKHVPLYPAVGNHEYHTLNAQPFRDVFALPPGEGAERWYSFDWGRVHFAVVDPMADLAPQVAWLDRDLAATDRPWKIVYMHAPMYSSGHHGSDLAVRRAFAPILERHDVQLVLAGHDHHYERMKPQNGVYYVVTGGGGKGTYRVADQDFTAHSDEVIHYVYLEIAIDYLTLHAIDAMGTEFDSLIIRKP